MNTKHFLASVAVVSTGTLAMIAAQNPPPREPQTPSQTPPPRQQPTTPPSQDPNRPKTPGGDAKGHMDTPPYAQTLGTDVPQGTLHIFTESNFAGDQATLDKSRAKTGAMTIAADNIADDATSLRWNLPPGMLVVLFEDETGKGDQLAIWGKGQIADLGKCDFNDQASAWACYDLGHKADAPSAGDVIMPQGSQALATTLAEGSIELFDDQNFAGEAQRVTQIHTQRAGQWATLPGESAVGSEKENAASSIRWNLPDGVVVLLAASDDGNNNLVLFGSGQYADLDACGFNNRASRWTWAHISAMGSGMGGDKDKGKSRDMPE